MPLVSSIVFFFFVTSGLGIFLDVNNVSTHAVVNIANGATTGVTKTGNFTTRRICKAFYGVYAHVLPEGNKNNETYLEQERESWLKKPKTTPGPVSPSTGLSYRAQVSISIYSVVGFFVVIGTIYDVIVSRKTSKTRSNSKIMERQPPSQSIQCVSYQHADQSLDGCPIENIQEITKAQSTSKWKYWLEIVQRRLHRCVLKNKTRVSSFNLKQFMKRLLLCFSLYTNGRRLLNTSVGAGTLRTVNGIRFLSITWVILGHTLEHIRGACDNSTEMERWVLQRWTYQPLENAGPSVDSFFTLSGLLVSYLTLKELHRAGGKFNILMYYFHRYFRLTAPMGMVMLFVIPLMEYFETGPHRSNHHTYCEDTWWKTILYVGNLDVDKKSMCMSVTWYMMNDMQFYLLSPLILLPLYFRPKLGIVIWSMFLVTTLTATGVISRIHKLSAISYEPGGGDRSKLIYNKPYTRMGPYLIGMAAGWILHRTNLKLKIKWPDCSDFPCLQIVGDFLAYANALIWAAAVSTGLAVIYGLVESDQRKFRLTWDVAAFYLAVHRTAWGVALCWVVIAGATNNGGFVNTILSWKPFVFLSRCCYMAYLIHPNTIEWFFNSRVKRLHLTDIGVVYRCLGSISIAFVVSSAATLVMEAPILNIETLIFRRERRK